MARRTRFWDRPTGDLLVLLVAATVCGSVFAGGAVLTVYAFVHPEKDISVAFGQINDVVNTMIGLLAGFLAGRSDMRIDRQRLDDGPGREE